MPDPILIGIHGVTERVSATKRCTSCRKRKPSSAFYKHARAKDGLQSVCKPCIREYRKEWRVNNPDKMTAQYRRRKLKKYGITVEQYEEQLAHQGGGCAICGKKCKTGKNLAVDHDHDTGELRGLLCAKCNTAVGNIDDDPEIARKMMEYLR